MNSNQSPCTVWLRKLHSSMITLAVISACTLIFAFEAAIAFGHASEWHVRYTSSGYPHNVQSWVTPSWVATMAWSAVSALGLCFIYTVLCTFLTGFDETK